MCVANMTADVRASLDTGDVDVTPGVLQGVKEMCVANMAAAVRASLDSGYLNGDVTLTTHAVQGVRCAILSRVNAPYASNTITMGINVKISVMLAVLTRHVTLHQESVMLVGMVILEHTVTCHATAYVLKVDAIGTLGHVMNVWA